MKKRIGNRQMIFAVLILLALLLSAGIFWVQSKYVFRASLDGITVDRYEKNVEPMDTDEDIFADEDLNEANGDFRIHINHLPSYDTANGTYNLQIWNPSNNSYLMRVTITQGQNTVLHTGLIRTGYKMDNAAMDGATAGSALATFTAYDKMTLEEIGYAEVVLTLPAIN